MVENLERSRVSGFSGVPSTYAILAANTDFLRRGLPDLRYLTQAGGGMTAALTRRLLDEFPPHVRLFVMYGQTEASARLSYVPPERLREKLGSIGIPIPGVSLTIRDEHGRECAPGEVGEVVAAGENLMQGYWNDPAETALVLKSDGLHTGDLGRKDDDGFIFLVDRIKNMIKVGANRVSPREIEDVIAEVAGVAEVCVAGVPDELARRGGGGVRRGRAGRPGPARTHPRPLPREPRPLQGAPRRALPGCPAAQRRRQGPAQRTGAHRLAPAADPRYGVVRRYLMKTPVLILAAVAVVVLLVLGFRFNRALAAGTQEPAQAGAGSFYDLSTRTLAGEPADLAVYRGQVALVVNTASKCGLTPQYAGLQALYGELAPRGFVVLGFPSNDFMGQEPGTPAEIQSFCDANYHVTFPLFEKSKVKGDDRGEIYRWLTRDLEEPTWNFTKYLVGRDGRVIARFGPKTTPDDPNLRARIEAR